MNNGSKTNQQLVLEIDELRARLDVAQQRLQEANERMQAEMAEHKGTEQVLEEQLKFEAFLAETSSRFINLPADQIDDVIEDAQRRICESLDIDLLAVWQLSNEDPVVLTAIHYYSVQQGPQPPGLLRQEDFPWFVKQLQAGRIVVVPSLEEMPAEAARDREVCRQLGIKSNLSLPLSVGGGPLIGVLGLNTTRAERDWPDALVKQLQLIGQIFANALARKRFELALRESEERLSVAADAADVGLWVLDCRTRVFWASEKARAIFGYSADQVINMERFEALVHRDDWQLVQESIERALQAGAPVNVEYRIRLGDSHTRWIASRGRPHFTSTGEADRIMGVSIDITERKLAEQALKERLRFETLLAEISSHFVNLPADQIDSEIEDAQRRICEHLDLDRSTLWQACEGELGTLRLTHLNHPSGSLSPPERMNGRDFFPWITQKVLGGETVIFSKMTDIPPEAGRDRENLLSYGTKSDVVIPLSVGEGPVFGMLTFAVMREERSWPETAVKGFKLIAQVFANALARKRADEQLKQHVGKIEELKQRLERENVYLQEEVKLLVEHTEIVGQSLSMKKVLSQAEQVAGTDSTVLILGETGTGKELLSRAIHKMSARKDRPLITVNCASLPPTLIESELFGRERGAYTGALTKMIGRFEIADGSTLFLDEIGEIPLELQSKLLRVLEEGDFERLGSTKTLHVNVRMIAATNRDIEQEVKDGNFRKDLFYRLNVFPIVIPPLREHPEDIPSMVWAFVKEFQKRMGKEIESISRKTMEALQSYSWPGNVRELRNVIEHAMILSKGKALVVHVPKLGSSEAGATRNLEEMERRHIAAVLERTGWRVAGKGGAAEVLGLKRSTLISKMNKLRIHRSAS
jgi:formate hydrogenlyase transcriptional activator